MQLVILLPLHPLLRLREAGDPALSCIWELVGERVLVWELMGLVSEPAAYLQPKLTLGIEHSEGCQWQRGRCGRTDWVRLRPMDTNPSSRSPA